MLPFCQSSKNRRRARSLRVCVVVVVAAARWAARDKHGGLQQQAQQRGGTRVDVDRSTRLTHRLQGFLSSSPFLSTPTSVQREAAPAQATPCVMLEQVVDNWWLAREAVSSAMGLWGWSWGRRGPSGFGSASTAEEVTAGADATSLTAIVTGATNGIGKETARVLALRGAKVIIPARTLESGQKVKESLADQVPGCKLHVMEMDLSSLSSVRNFARSFNSSHEHLNILINNAGIMACPYQLSEDGIELQFATNHVGHFLLTSLLLDKMKSTARETGVQGRIINVSSVAHKRSDGTCFELKKLNDKARYNPFIAYSHSKLANILHANELSRRFQEEGCNLTANSLHPGVIFTNIVRYIAGNSALLPVLSPLAKLVLKGVPQGAATTCYLALHPDLKNVSGKYFADCNEAIPTAVARDAELAKKVWLFSEELVGTNAVGEPK